MCKYTGTRLDTDGICVCIQRNARGHNVPISNFTSKQSAENVFRIDGWNVTIKVGDRSLTAFSNPSARAQPELTPSPSRSSPTLAHNLYYDRGGHIINLIKRSALKIVLLVRQLLTAAACPIPLCSAVSLVRFLRFYSSPFAFSSLRHRPEQVSLLFFFFFIFFPSFHLYHVSNSIALSPSLSLFLLVCLSKLSFR